MTKRIDVDFEKLEELQKRYEPLREELHKYLEEDKFGYIIRHPFCDEPVHDLERCALIHHRIDRRAAKADECFEANDWNGWVSCTQVSSRPEWFAKDAHLLPDAHYWISLGVIYGNMVHTHYCRGILDDLFRADRPGREQLMTPEEREVLAKLPDEFTVYRGYSDDDCEGYAEGISWTLDRRVATWYANSHRDHENPRVITGKVRKEDIWAYFDGGDLLLPPEAVYDKRDRAAWNEKARHGWSQFIKKPYDVTKLFLT